MSEGIMSIYPDADADESDENNDADEQQESIVFIEAGSRGR